MGGLVRHLRGEDLCLGRPYLVVGMNAVTLVLVVSVVGTLRCLMVVVKERKKNLAWEHLERGPDLVKEDQEKPSQTVYRRNLAPLESSPRQTSFDQHSLDLVGRHQVVVPYDSNLLQDLKEVNGCIAKIEVGQKAL